jgi:hypothetical protein
MGLTKGAALKTTFVTVSLVDQLPRRSECGSRDRNLIVVNTRGEDRDERSK